MAPTPPAPRPPIHVAPAAVDESVASLARLDEPGTWQVGLPSKFTTLAGRSAALMGARVGFLKREKHVVSFAGFRRVGEDPGDRAGRLSGVRGVDFRYGGLLLGWESDGLGLFQSYGHALVGASRTAVTWVPTGAVATRRSERMGFVLEPELGAAWKIARPVRLAVGVSWRGVWGADTGPLERKDLDGFAASIGLLVGLYPDPAIPVMPADAVRPTAPPPTQAPTPTPSPVPSPGG